MSSTLKSLTLGGFISFFAFGFIDNLKGPLLPELFRDGEYTYAQGGTIVFAAYVGFIIATLVTGVIADIVGNRTVLFLAATCLCAGSIGIGATSSYTGVMLFMGTVGLGLGAIELGANGLMVELHSEARGRYLNLLATFHGLGSLLVPLYAAALIEIGSTWRQVYLSSILLAVPLLILFRPGAGAVQAGVQPGVCDLAGNDEPSQPRPRHPWKQLLRVGFTGRMICFYILLAAYVAVELSVAAWMMEFLQQERGLSVRRSSLYLSSFFVLLMLGRLLGAFIVERMNYIRAVFIALLCTTICLSGGIFGTDSWAVLLPLSGLFMSIVFPTLTAAVTRMHLTNTGTILGLLFACGGVGGALGPWTVGFVSQWAGPTLGLASTLAFAALAIVALACLKAQPESAIR